MIRSLGSPICSEGDCDEDVEGHCSAIVAILRYHFKEKIFNSCFVGGQEWKMRWANKMRWTTLREEPNTIWSYLQIIYLFIHVYSYTSVYVHICRHA